MCLSLHPRAAYMPDDKTRHTPAPGYIRYKLARYNKKTGELSAIHQRHTYIEHGWQYAKWPETFGPLLIEDSFGFHFFVDKQDAIAHARREYRSQSRAGTIVLMECRVDAFFRAGTWSSVPSETWIAMRVWGWSNIPMKRKTTKRRATRRR